MKKSILLSLFFIFCSMWTGNTFSVDADSNPDLISSGQCGKDMHWELYKDGVLMINGGGSMWDFSDGFIDADQNPLTPWRNNIHDIKTVRIGENVDNIGKFAFAYDSLTGSSYDNLQSVYIGSSVRDIGDDAFLLANNLKNVVFEGDYIGRIGAYAFMGTAIESIDLPDSLMTVSNNAFACTQMKSVSIPLYVNKIEDRAFGYNFTYENGIFPINGFTIYGYPRTEAERYYQECLLVDYRDYQKWNLDSNNGKDVSGNFPADGTVHFVDLSQNASGSTIPPFIDVLLDDWFYDDVKYVFNKKLMIGIRDTQFDPHGSVTVAQAITMAARIHSLYTTGQDDFDQGTGADWYQVYVDYAREVGIIGDIYANLNMNVKATRAQFADIFSRALPEKELRQINTIPDRSIPDVDMKDSYAQNVYKLYRAGILTGNDERGTFSPLSNIIRAEAAAIVTRMSDGNRRKKVELTAPVEETGY